MGAFEYLKCGYFSSKGNFGMASNSLGKFKQLAGTWTGTLKIYFHIVKVKLKFKNKTIPVAYFKKIECTCQVQIDWRSAH